MNTGKNVQKVCDTAGTGLQPEVEFQPGPDNAATLQAQFTSTGSFELQIQIAPDAPWIVFGSAITQATPQPVNLARAFLRYRINVTANAGTIRVWIMS